MILPMKKVCLAVLDSEQDRAIARLGEIGVFHIEKVNPGSEKLTKASERKTRTESAMGLIQTYKAPKKRKALAQQGGRERRQNPNDRRRGRRAGDKMGDEELEPYSLDAVNAPVRPELTDYMMGMSKTCKEIENKETILTRERLRIQQWGEFNPDDIKAMSAVGLQVYLYELTPDIFKKLPSDVAFIKVSEDKVAVRMIVLDSEIPGIAPFRLPEDSLSKIDSDLQELRSKLIDTQNRIRSLADRRPALQKEMDFVLDEINFETTRAELVTADDIPSEYGISFLKGYIPAEDGPALTAAVAEHGWAMVSFEPSEEDMVPTKLKSNKFANLLSPITGFLGIVPGYREPDISSWFMLFICIFIGMIFADAGYGLVMLLLGLFSVIKYARNGVPLAVKMLLLLSIFCIGWGVVVCSWFGLDEKYIPQFLKDISVPFLSTARGTPKALVDENLLFFCFTLGAVHLSIARIIRVVNGIREKTLAIFGDIGSMAMLLGMYNVILFLMVNGERFPLLPASIYMLLGGLLLTLVFGAYEKSIGQSIKDGLKNIISVILGVTGVFSDIMSYIRLWAVGLAGASISSTVNTMAGPMLGSFLVFMGIILLVFGHGLNMIINVLSVLVHGVRLNTLEFSGHVKLTWSGTAYNPFTVKR